MWQDESLKPRKRQKNRRQRNQMYKKSFQIKNRNREQHSALEKFGFGKTFIDWVKIFLNDQELCVINGGITTKYFKLEKGA